MECSRVPRAEGFYLIPLPGVLAMTTLWFEESEMRCLESEIAFARLRDHIWSPPVSCRKVFATFCVLATILGGTVSLLFLF